MTATISATESQLEFYKRWLMTRESFSPKDFGVNLSKSEFTDKMVELFAVTYRDHWTIDELLLHPREAAAFCDDARRALVAFDVPDDCILRVILGRRKNPSA